tara:strand:- start:78453 stop:79010 length:558 start_codon:yes stop_codon:yes gene_type:complete
MPLNIPNILTLARIFILPFLLWMIYQDSALWAYGAFVVYALSAFTDYLDGYLARKLNQTSAFGTFIDPIADKIFVLGVLLVMIDLHVLSGLWLIAVLIIVIRELLVSGLREFLGPHNIKLPVTQLAKWKTTIQMLALALLILAPAFPLALFAGKITLIAAAIITLITGMQYLASGLKAMKGLDEQ